MHTEDPGADRVTDGGTGCRIELRADESTTQAVLRGIASKRDVAVTDLEPVGDQVGFGAVDALVQHARERDNRLSVRFTVGDYVVWVHDTDTVRVVDDTDESIP